MRELLCHPEKFLRTFKCGVAFNRTEGCTALCPHYPFAARDGRDILRRVLSRQHLKASSR